MKAGEIRETAKRLYILKDGLQKQRFDGVCECASVCVCLCVCMRTCVRAGATKKKDFGNPFLI